MKKPRTNNHWALVLRFNGRKVDRGKVKRAYRAYRREMGIPERCDNENCRFYSEPLLWNGKRLIPILDHLDGNRRDHSRANLQFLCPNCASQVDTHGGRNRGRVVDESEYGYTLNNPDGTKIVAATMIAKSSSSCLFIAATDDQKEAAEKTETITTPNTTEL
jgi:hypothetical protein